MNKTHFQKCLGVLLLLLFKGTSATVYNAYLVNNYKQHSICILEVLTSSYNLLIMGIKLWWLNCKQFLKAWGQANSSKQPGNISPKAVHLKRSPRLTSMFKHWQKSVEDIVAGIFSYTCVRGWIVDSIKFVPSNLVQAGLSSLYSLTLQVLNSDSKFQRSEIEIEIEREKK